jgi:hypothetical protein
VESVAGFCHCVFSDLTGHGSTTLLVWWGGCSSKYFYVKKWPSYSKNLRTPAAAQRCWFSLQFNYSLRASEIFRIWTQKFCEEHLFILLRYFLYLYGVDSVLGELYLYVIFKTRDSSLTAFRLGTYLINYPYKFHWQYLRPWLLLNLLRSCGGGGGGGEK